jgi:iron complex transport system substrate-binding protein
LIARPAIANPDAMAYPPERIVCLTEETVETLYLLGESARIVGVTGYAVRPPQVRREKPRVGAFTSADIPKIKALNPDLVLTFSDLQADIAAGLIREGLTVHAFNQRDIAGILAMIRTLGALVGRAGEAEGLAAGYAARLDALRAAPPPIRPRVYFEEWDDPPITGIGWVSELIEAAGGTDCFAHLRHHQGARDRIIDPSAVIEAAPDLIIGSWCGKKFRPEKLAARPGWRAIPAIAAGRVVEIKSPLILQPGPACLTDGLDALRQAIEAAAQAMHSAGAGPAG